MLFIGRFMGRKSKREKTKPEPKPKPQKKDNSILYVKLFILFLIVIIVCAWVFTEEEPKTEIQYSYAIVAKQGDGNLSSGCLIEPINVIGPELEIKYFYFEVGKENQSPFILRWPEDGNLTSYDIDSGLKPDDGDYWGHFQKIGFDTSPAFKNQNIDDGDKILDDKTNKVICQDDFVYYE